MSYITYFNYYLPTYNLPAYRKKNLRQLGDVMENDRLPKQLLYSQLYKGKKKPSATKTQIQGCGEKKHEASTDRPEILAGHGRQWRSVIKPKP